MDQVLGALSAEFEKLYVMLTAVDSAGKLSRAAVAGVLFGRARSGGMEQLDYNLLFRWFVGLSLTRWWTSRCSPEPRAADRCRHRRTVHGGGVEPGAVKALLSDDHFSVDGTLIEAWASMKAFAPGRQRGRRRQAATASGTFMAKRSNETHASTTDPVLGCIARTGSAGQAGLSGARSDGEPDTRWWSTRV